MPAQRAILANIHDNNLDPNVAHSKLQNGSLISAVVEKEEKEHHAQIFASVMLTDESTELPVAELEKAEVQQEETAKKPKKGFQKKATQNIK